MSKIKARNLLLFLKDSVGDYKAIGCATSCELDESTEVIEVSSPTQGEWTNYIKKRKSWKVTTQHILSTDNATQFESLNGETVELQFATTSDSNEARDPSTRVATYDYNRRGTAICTRCTVTAKNGEWVNGSFEFTGSGKLETVISTE